MAPKKWAKSVKAGAKDPRNPKQTSKSKMHINTHEDEGHCGASVRSEGTETTLQDTANAVANVSAAPVDSIEPVDPGESAEVSSPAVLPECNGRSGQPTEEDEVEIADFLVAEDFRSRYASGSVANTMVQMKTDPNYCAPAQKGGGT